MDWLASHLERRYGAKESRLIIQYTPAIVVLSLVTLLTYFYYNAFSPILSIMAKEYGFSENERDYYLGSLLNTIFFVIGCPCSLIASVIADSNSRKRTFMTITGLCHAFSFLMQFFKSYKLLCIWRGLSGALVLSALPIYLSILGDIFPSTLRSLASVISSVIVGCGMILGQTLSGYLCPLLGWRFFFRFTSIFGMISVYMINVVRLPEQGEADGVKKETTMLTSPKPIGEKELEEALEIEGGAFSFNWTIIKEIFSVNSNWLLFLQGLPGSIPWGVYTIYLSDILCTERHFSIEIASTLILFFGVGAGVGSAASGAISHYLCKWNKSLLPLTVGACYFLSLPLISFLFSLQLQLSFLSVVINVLLLLFIGLLLSIPGPCIRMILLNVNQPQCRSTVIAISEVFNNIGRIVGPILFTSQLTTMNRIDSMLRISQFFYIAAILCGILMATYAVDEERVILYVNSLQEALHSDVETSPYMGNLDPSPMVQDEKETTDDPSETHPLTHEKTPLLDKAV